MARDFNTSSFSRYSNETAEDADPRIGLVNLADVMLVFACGLMLALVAAGSMNVSGLTEVIQAQQVTEVSDIEELSEMIDSGGSGYQELGKVYQDPMTGKLYMLEEDLAGTDLASGTETPSNPGASTDTSLPTGNSTNTNTPTENTSTPSPATATP